MFASKFQENWQTFGINSINTGDPMAWLLSLISDRALYMVIWMVENPITIADSIYFKSIIVLTLSPHHPRTSPSAIVVKRRARLTGFARVLSNLRLIVFVVKTRQKQV